MAIKTNLADTGDMCIIQAEGCRIMTRLWWGNGCITVCSNCSKLPEVTDASMRELCGQEGWGPIPTENTDLEVPCD